MGKSRQGRAGLKGLGWSCCERDFGGRIGFGGRVGSPSPLCLSFPERFWGWAALHTGSSLWPSLRLCPASSYLLYFPVYSFLGPSLIFCYCLRIEANTSQTRAILPWRVMDFSGKSKGPFRKFVLVPSWWPGRSASSVSL